MNVIVYTLPACPACIKTKTAFAMLGIQVTEVDLSDNDAVRADLQELGYRSAPVVKVDNEHWSGFNLARIQAVGALVAV